MRLENDVYLVSVADDGTIIGFCEKKTGNNLADKNGTTGTACFTLKTEDIRKLPHENMESYADHSSHYREQKMESQDNDRKVFLIDQENDIYTEYYLTENGLQISSETKNPNISEFGLNLDLNFMGKKGDCYMRQLLPTSPYTSDDGKFMYCLMQSPNGKYVAAAATTRCDGWKIKYSPYCAGHFVLKFQFLASFDQVYGGSDAKKIQITLMCADSKEEAFGKLNQLYKRALTVNVLSGGFDGTAYVKTIGEAEQYQIISPSGKLSQAGADGKLYEGGYAV